MKRQWAYEARLQAVADFIGNREVRHGEVLAFLRFHYGAQMGRQSARYLLTDGRFERIAHGRYRLRGIR